MYNVERSLEMERNFLFDSHVLRICMGKQSYHLEDHKGGGKVILRWILVK
jgi:hypothetical protein